MAKIRNVSRKEVETFTFPQYDILIQISDPSSEHPKPAGFFRSVHQFSFLDIEDDTPDLFEEFGITQVQARDIVEILQTALAADQSVLVHCHIGICRSGAVAEVGVMLGFEDTGAHRQPNVSVKKALMKELGWAYD